jgi:hypothetical protein
MLLPQLHHELTQGVHCKTYIQFGVDQMHQGVEITKTTERGGESVVIVLKQF